MKPHKFVITAACMLIMRCIYAQETANVSVHFDFDKYDINASDLASLKNFKHTHPDIESIIIDGYADPVGTDEYNYALSLKRCNTVKQALGYDEEKTEVVLKINAHGEKGLLYETNPENRVAIVSVNQKKRNAIPEPAKKEEPDVTVEPVTQEQYAAPEPHQPPVNKTEAISLIPKNVGNDESELLRILENSKVGESVVLSEIYFEEGRHQFLKSSKPALNAMLNALKAMPSLQLEIEGHMCCGDELAMDGFDLDTKEFQLSNNRAKAVYDYMVENGISPSRLTFKGFGSRKHFIYPEVTDEDRNKNRRVEFLITKK